MTFPHAACKIALLYSHFSPKKSFFCTSTLYEILYMGFVLGEFSVIQYLLGTAGDSVNAQDKDGNTLLHVACRGRNSKKKQEALDILLKAAANPSVSNRKGEKPIDILSNFG